MQEKRRFSRIPIAITTTLYYRDIGIPVQTMNLSLKGALVELNEPIRLERNEPFKIRIVLNEDVDFSVDAELVHTEGEHLGFLFTGIDTDGLTHLRSILEYNAVDPDVIDAELPFLIRQSSTS